MDSNCFLYQYHANLTNFVSDYTLFTTSLTDFAIIHSFTYDFTYMLRQGIVYCGSDFRDYLRIHLIRFGGILYKDNDETFSSVGKVYDTCIVFRHSRTVGQPAHPIVIWSASTTAERDFSSNNSGNVQVEVRCEKAGYVTQRRRLNLRQAIDQKEISAKFNLAKEENL